MTIWYSPKEIERTETTANRNVLMLLYPWWLTRQLALILDNTCGHFLDAAAKCYSCTDRYHTTGSSTLHLWYFVHIPRVLYLSGRRIWCIKRWPDNFMTLFRLKPLVWKNRSLEKVPLNSKSIVQWLCDWVKVKVKTLFINLLNHFNSSIFIFIH